MQYTLIVIFRVLYYRTFDTGLRQRTSFVHLTYLAAEGILLPDCKIFL